MLILLCSICLLLKCLSMSGRSQNDPNGSKYSSLLVRMKQTKVPTLDEFSTHSSSDGKDDLQEIALNTFTPLHSHPIALTPAEDSRRNIEQATI